MVNVEFLGNIQRFFADQLRLMPSLDVIKVGGRLPSSSSRLVLQARNVGANGVLAFVDTSWPHILQPFLTGRTQMVMVNDAVSDTYGTLSGVLQGTCLGT